MLLVRSWVERSFMTHVFMFEDLKIGIAGLVFGLFCICIPTEWLTHNMETESVDSSAWRRLGCSFSCASCGHFKVYHGTLPRARKNIWQRNFRHLAVTVLSRARARTCGIHYICGYCMSILYFLVQCTFFNSFYFSSTDRIRRLLNLRTRSGS